MEPFKTYLRFTDQNGGVGVSQIPLLSEVLEFGFVSLDTQDIGLRLTRARFLIFLRENFLFTRMLHKKFFVARIVIYSKLVREWKKYLKFWLW